MDAVFKRVLHDFSWLLDLRSIDYFVQKQWSRLPSSWQSAFKNFKVDVLRFLVFVLIVQRFAWVW